MEERKLAVLENKTDPEIGKYATKLLDSGGDFLHHENDDVSSPDRRLNSDSFLHCIKGTHNNFGHIAVQDIIVNFFYGKPGSVGVVFAAQKRVKEVPFAMIALASAAVFVLYAEFSTEADLLLASQCDQRVYNRST